VRQAEGADVPGDQAGAGRQAETQVVLGIAGVITKGFQRQPFDAGALAHRDAGDLFRHIAL